jgi:hypothetical protein
MASVSDHPDDRKCFCLITVLVQQNTLGKLSDILVLRLEDLWGPSAAGSRLLLRPLGRSDRPRGTPLESYVVALYLLPFSFGVRYYFRGW